MKLLVIDGNSILNRAFYGIKLLTTKEGYYTNAIYGFLTMMNRIKDETNPDAISVAFDMRAPTFRHKEYDGYKSNRKGMPEELAQQLPILKELLGYLGYKIVECEGFEADDILGTLANECEKSGNTCVIATGDRDSLQLISKNTTVRIAATKMGRPEASMYDEAKIEEVYGVQPKQLIDIKAIQGDSSDCIPGVAGIGQKGASELIQKFGNLDYIYENIDSIDIKEGMRKKLIAGKESAYMSRMLGTIRKDAPIDTNLEHYMPRKMDNANVCRLMTKLEFFSLMDKMGISNCNEQRDEETSGYKNVNVQKCTSLTELESTIKNAGTMAFICDYDNEVMNKIYISVLENVYIVERSEDFNEFLKNIFEDEKIEKHTHDSKAVYVALKHLKIEARSITFDTMLAAYLLNPSSSDYSLIRLINEYGVNTSIQSEKQDLSVLTSILPRLVAVLSDKIKQNKQESLLNDIELPLSRVLANMEQRGFGVDKDGIEKYGIELQNKIDVIQSEIYKLVGYEFNINSPKQLGEALFKRLGLPTGKKTKSGYSTNAEVLEGLRYEHPCIDMILEYRTLSKLKSTYCDGMLKVISEDGRIHSKFNQVETRTGRISSTEPNLQNIPVKTPVGRELRKFFKAKEGYTLVDADYSQIELRVLAYIANDQNMIEAFKNDEDIHATTASQVFHMPANMLTPLMRSRAKAVNFGIVYGISAFSLSKDIGVTRKEADNYIKAYLSHYSGVAQYMKQSVEKAKENGYAQTIFGRRRYLPELSSSNFNLRAFGERVAMNMPVQGTAADIIKIAMIKVEERLKREKLKAKLILQVHDELIVESPDEEADKVANILKEEMEGAVQFSVPMVADACIGKTWYDAKG